MAGFPEAQNRLVACAALQLVELDEIRREDPRVAAALASTMTEVCEQVLAGRLLAMTERGPMDDAGQRRFRRSAEGLLEFLRRDRPPSS